MKLGGADLFWPPEYDRHSSGRLVVPLETQTSGTGFYSDGGDDALSEFVG